MTIDMSAVQELLDKEAIRSLVSRYCNAADRHDHEKMRSLYWEDAIDDHGAMFNGPAMEFIDILPQIQAPMEVLHHNATSMNIAVEGDIAEGEIYLLALHKVQEADRSYDVLVGGRFFDRYSKRDGVWKYQHHAIVADWSFVNEPSHVTLSHPFLAGAHIGRPGPDDPSYRFFKLLHRGA
ncbi:nuclear transport factor 2 family protein [Croceicoccus sp. F390]|uniref:Nuclear transport factor 2 family protein n=1 Tax=Croceicoccus esteveae TaxID=3075597 RepID=A0ABU2ZG41_9SPHN|nr:nuclear transport factor 2 family protein [Croceicoccus sp. F390]MDT0575370.1 nuclear transport factor 2 family protein [Croceicoccus sp. F390]